MENKMEKEPLQNSIKVKLREFGKMEKEFIGLSGMNRHMNTLMKLIKTVFCLIMIANNYI